MHDVVCISIFIPAHRAGKETLQGQDMLQLKNQIKEVRQKLTAEEIGPRDMDKLLKPVEQLLEDGDFWRHQSDGLAIFAADGIFKKYMVPVTFEPFNYVANDFYLKPLIPLFNDDGLFYLLTLKSDEIRFYEGSRYQITRVEIDDLVPQRLEDVVGYDYEQKSLQFRTQQGNRGEGMFHGHGEGSADEKNELQRFFRAVDKGLMSLLHDRQNPPMVVACFDSHFAVYREVNSYKNIFSKNISGNPADFDAIALHAEAWELLQPQFAKDRQEKSELFLKALTAGKASSDIRDVVPAALDGRIDTLFVEQNNDLYGIYDAENRQVIPRVKNSSGDVSLLNLATVKVFEQGGVVYFMKKEDMPDDTSPVNALFRY